MTVSLRCGPHVARESRLKPRLGPAAEAASIRPFTGRRRAASSLALPGHAYDVIEGFLGEAGQMSMTLRVRSVHVARESRLKPRLGPAAEAASITT